jgi:hypothetical protein
MVPPGKAIFGIYSFVGLMGVFEEQVIIENHRTAV